MNRGWLPRSLGSQTNANYKSRIISLLGSSIVSYWPMNEMSGTAARDLSALGNNGTYDTVSLANTASPGGIGGFAPLFDGSDSVVDVYSAGLNTAFDPTKVTLAIWAKVSAAGVWTDSTVRYLVQIGADANNAVRIYKAGANNTLYVDYKAGGTAKTGGAGSHSPTGWTHYGITADVAGDAVKAYINGVQVGSTLTGLGTWSGALSSSLCVIGASATNSNNPYSGWLSHPLLLNKVATSDEMLKLAQWGGA